MVELLVGFGCFITFFALVPSIGLLVQAGALVCFFVAAAYALIMNQVKPIKTSAGEIILFAAGVWYVAVGVIQDEDSGLPSMAFLGAIVLVAIVSRATTLERVLDVGAWVMLLCVLACLVATRDGVTAALSLSVSKAGLARYTPFGNAANLTGYTFGGGAILLARRVFLAPKKLERWIMGGAALVATLFVLAASARSSLIAMMAAGLVAVFFEIGIGRLLSFSSVRVAIVAMLLVGVVFNQKLFGYLTQMLELDSATRGVGSGGSGRADLWARGFALVFQDPLVTLFGGGFRSSSSGQIGFSTESSYITILLDSGIILGAAVILVFWYAPIKALVVTEPAKRFSSPLLLLASFMTFLVVESFFNRYLLAIGNPISLLSLFVLLSLCSMRREVESPT